MIAATSVQEWASIVLPIAGSIGGFTRYILGRLDGKFVEIKGHLDAQDAAKDVLNQRVSRIEGHLNLPATSAEHSRV
jgi:membrane protein YqaA with SNARE-associated domain